MGLLPSTSCFIPRKTCISKPSTSILTKSTLGKSISFAKSSNFAMLTFCVSTLSYSFLSEAAASPGQNRCFRRRREAKFSSHRFHCQAPDCMQSGLGYSKLSEYRKSAGSAQKRRRVLNCDLGECCTSQHVRRHRHIDRISSSGGYTFQARIAAKVAEHIGGTSVERTKSFSYEALGLPQETRANKSAC